MELFILDKDFEIDLYEEKIEMIEVSTKVNKVVNDDPSLIEEHHEYTLF